MPRLAFGKYNGVDLHDVPADYLEWLVTQRQKDLTDYQEELNRREAVETASSTLVEKIVHSGYKALAKSAHPDAGGSEAAFKELGAAYEQLKMILTEVKTLR